MHRRYEEIKQEGIVSYVNKKLEGIERPITYKKANEIAMNAKEEKIYTTAEQVLKISKEEKKDTQETKEL